MSDEKIAVCIDEALLRAADLLACALDLSRGEVFALALRQYVEQDCEPIIRAELQEAQANEAYDEEAEQVLESQVWNYEYQRWLTNQQSSKATSTG